MKRTAMLCLIALLAAAGWGQGIKKATTYSIAGRAVAGASVGLYTSNAGIAGTAADTGGMYQFTGIAPGTYSVRPTRQGCIFLPMMRTVTVSDSNVANVNFAADCDSQDRPGGGRKK